MTGILRCSFCNKDQNDVRKLIAGPKVFICDECIDLCNDILADDRRIEPPSPNRVASLPGVWCSLCRLPIVPAEAIAVPDRGLVCRPCSSAVNAATLAAEDDSERSDRDR